MNNLVSFEKLLVYSEEHNLISNIDFKDGVNIIYGKNTSGKSTLFQSILYTLGINEYNETLKDILNYNPIFRLDCRFHNNNSVTKLTFIRNDSTLVIRDSNGVSRKFIGINSNTSIEHIRLKEYISRMFGFKMKLEQNGKIKDAPIEALLLPYYVSQTLGWVYLRKSFSNLEFYKSFKEDYLDYYSGITNTVDREEKTRLERMKKQLVEQLEFYKNIIDKNPELEISKLEDEENEKYSVDYIEQFKDLNVDMVKVEKEYTIKCNELAYVSKRMGILRTVKKNLEQQTPEIGKCPTCDRSLKSDVSDWYKYLQAKNDTESELQSCKNKSVTLKSEINRLKKKMEAQKEIYSENYSVLMSKYSKKQSYKSWLENKTNILLIDKCNTEILRLTNKISEIEQSLKNYKSDEAILAERKDKNREFSILFSNYLSKLRITKFSDPRFLYLYDISAFPSQGVELHKTVLAYHFAFNMLIKETKGIHRIPFMLDAIFREDIETENKELILEFISKNKPKDIQIILSIAESIKDNEIVKKYNSIYFDNNANLVSIGDSKSERSFLYRYEHNLDDLIEETISYMYIE